MNQETPDHETVIRASKVGKKFGRQWAVRELSLEYP